MPNLSLSLCALSLFFFQHLFSLTALSLALFLLLPFYSLFHSVSFDNVFLSVPFIYFLSMLFQTLS